MNALHRLVCTQVTARSKLDLARDTDKLFSVLKQRHVPVVMNKVDHTMGFKCDMQVVVRALKLIGFHPESHTENEQLLTGKDFSVRVFHPHEDWNPVLQVIN